MSISELRAHHALCVEFFQGKGYSPAFVDNMAELVGALRASDPLLTLRGAADGVCRSCPHNNGGVCDSAEKTARYDAGVLRLTGLNAGETLRWSALRALVRERILDAGRLCEVCGDCQWYDICSQAAVG
ncbi:MAG: DUF1284 domain-containing protein [Oscillospiraceae bacterium]|nr:DUF1284 domain-containing protein [Oscillospiraceae bacterium]